MSDVIPLMITQVNWPAYIQFYKSEYGRDVSSELQTIGIDRSDMGALINHQEPNGFADFRLIHLGFLTRANAASLTALARNTSIVIKPQDADGEWSLLYGSLEDWLDALRGPKAAKATTTYRRLLNKCYSYYARSLVLNRYLSSIKKVDLPDGTFYIN